METQLYLNTYHGKVLASLNKNEGEWMNDGYSTFLANQPYAKLTIEPVQSQLSTVTLRCVIKPTNQTEYQRLNQARELLLSTTDEPLKQVLCYLNKYRMNEHRIVYNDTIYGEQCTMAVMEQANPGEIQWVYYGNNTDYSEVWTEEEMLPLETLLHERVPAWSNNYWQLRKVPTDSRKYFNAYYIATKYTWESGSCKGYTPEELVADLEKYFSH